MYYREKHCNQIHSIQFKIDFRDFLIIHVISRKAQYKNVFRRTIEILRRAGFFKANCCLKVYNAHFKVSIANFGISSKSVGGKCEWTILDCSLIKGMACAISDKVRSLNSKNFSINISNSEPQQKCVFTPSTRVQFNHCPLCTQVRGYQYFFLIYLSRHSTSIMKSNRNFETDTRIIPPGDTATLITNYTSAVMCLGPSF